MWRPLSRLLDLIGRAGLPISFSSAEFVVGSPRAVDGLGGFDWRKYLSGEALYEAWGPLDGSEWAPYHCVTLFAALDRLRGASAKVGPLADADVPGHLAVDAPVPPWADRRTWVIVDLPGPVSVTAGLLFARAGFQPVCTFDNWPNVHGVLKAEKILGALLHHAESAARAKEGLDPASPPVWLCDRDRYRAPKPPPGRFDNRYYLDERLVPGPATLARAGISRVVYVAPEAGPASADLAPHLAELAKKGIELLAANASEGAAFGKAVPLDAAPKAFSTMGFMRSSAGGFGGFVPQPSSGGG